jgi:hypothetical protein
VALLYATSSKGLCFFHCVLTFSDNLSSPSPLFVPPFFLPLYAESAPGLSGTTASYIGASYNLASSAGRIGFGLFADALLGGFNSLVACLVLVSVSTLLICLSSSRWNPFHYPRFSPLLLFGRPPSTRRRSLRRFSSERSCMPQNQVSPALAPRPFLLSSTAGITLGEAVLLREAVNVPFVVFYRSLRCFLRPSASSHGKADKAAIVYDSSTVGVHDRYALNTRRRRKWTRL